MTNSSEKTAKASRDTLDLDLDARLDQATSTLTLDSELLPSGDSLDQLLAQAKKEIDAESEKFVASESNEIDDDVNLDDVLVNENDELESKSDFHEIKSNAMTSLENQLAAAMGKAPNTVADEELDNLLGGAGFDFDSLLGEAATDELVVNADEDVDEEILMSAVEDLLNSSVEPNVVIDDLPEEIIEQEEAIVEPEIIVEDLTEEITEPQVVENLPEIIDEVAEETIEPKETELTVEPEAALDDLVDSVPFEDTLKVDSDNTEIDNFEEEFNNFDEVADSVEPLVEISTFDESFEDDLNAMQQLDGLNDAMENKNDTAGFDLLDDNATEKESATSVNESADDDWMKQLEGLEDIAPSTSDDLAEEAVADEDDWMKQLEGLDEEVESPPATVSLEKTEEAVADDDWMKQLEGLDDHDEETAKMLMDVGHDDSADEVVNRDFNIANEPANATNPQSETSVVDEETLIAKAADMAVGKLKDDQEHVMSQLRADQDAVESKNKKQFADAEEKRKKTATFGYIALGVGVIGLLGSAGIGWLSYGTKDKTETLSESVTALEEKVDGFLAKNPEKEIENIKTSVEQLNQKVEKLAAAQIAPVVPAVAVTTPENAKTSPKIQPEKTTNSPVALLNNKPAQTSPVIEEPKVADSNIVPALDSIAPKSPVNEKEHEPAKLDDTAKKAAEAEKAELAKKEAVKAEAEKIAKAKAEAAKKAKAEAELLSEKIAKATAVAKAAAATTKTEDQRKLLSEKATRYTGRMTRGMARGENQQKSKTVNKEILNAAIPPQKAVSAGKYSVNVVSYQQEWFAQSKAAEFRQKGIPVEVVPVDVNNHATRFRLKVAGFKNKADANAYAEKIKKSHKLGESWVGMN